MSNNNYFKSKNKVKFKIRKELLAILCVLVLIGVALFVMKLPTEGEKTLKRFESAEINFSETTSIRFADFDNVLKTAKSSEYTYFYFGNLSDATTKENIEGINNTANDYDIERMYFVESNFVTKKDREEDEDHHTYLKDLEKDFEAINNANTEFSLDITALWVFKDNKLIYNSAIYFDDAEDSYGPKNWQTMAAEAFKFNKEEIS